MTFKTIGNDQNNRDETKKTNLENKIRSSWLGRRFWNRTFEEPKQGSDILEIRELLDEEDDDVSQSSTK
jgi:hypothetical protein